MSPEGKFQIPGEPIDPKERHFRIVGKEREEKIAELMRTGRLSREQAETQIRKKEAEVDFELLNPDNKK